MTTTETKTETDDDRALRDVVAEAESMPDDRREDVEDVKSLTAALSRKLMRLRKAQYRAQSLPMEADVRARVEGTKSLDVGEIDVPDPDEAVQEVRAMLNRVTAANATARQRRRLEVLDALRIATAPRDEIPVEIRPSPRDETDRARWLDGKIRMMERGVPGGFDGELGRLIDAARDYAAELDRRSRTPGEATP